MSCSSCNNNVPQPVTVNQTCGITVDSTWVTNSDLVTYTGTNLTCIDVFTNDTLTTALQQINTSICPVNMSIAILDAIQASPSFTATFANFVNQTLINCTTTTTSSSTSTSTTTSSTSTTTTTTTINNACTITTTTTASIFTPVCLSYNTLNCINACLQNVPGGCSTFYLTTACAANFTAGCQIYANANYFPAPAGYYSYGGNCYVVTTGGIATTQSVCSTSTTSTTSTTTTKPPFDLCFSPIGTSCYEACFCQDVTVLSFASYKGGSGQPEWKFTLSQPLSVNVTISGAGVRGFGNSNCNIQNSSDSMNFASVTIPAGQVSGTYYGSILGMSCSTTHYKKLNGIVITGVVGSSQNGDIITIGGASVKIYIDLACNPYTC